MAMQNMEPVPRGADEVNEVVIREVVGALDYGKISEALARRYSAAFDEVMVGTDTVLVTRSTIQQDKAAPEYGYLVDPQKGVFMVRGKREGFSNEQYIAFYRLKKVLISGTKQI